MSPQSGSSIAHVELSRQPLFQQPHPNFVPTVDAERGYPLRRPDEQTLQAHEFNRQQRWQPLSLGRRSGLSDSVHVHITSRVERVRVTPIRAFALSSSVGPGLGKLTLDLGDRGGIDLHYSGDCRICSRRATFTLVGLELTAGMLVWS
jgi:hypothetical protein